MFYVNKKDKTDIIELLYSDNNACVIVSYKNTIDLPKGSIIKGSKKYLKNSYKKASDKIIKNIIPISEEFRKDIIDTYTRDKIGITLYTEDYIEISKKWEISEEQEILKSMTEEEYREHLDSLADKKE